MAASKRTCQEQEKLMCIETLETNLWPILVMICNVYI